MADPRHGAEIVQTLIDLYREAQMGETSSGLAGLREQAALPRQSILQRMFGPNRTYSREAAQMLRSLPPGFDPASDRDIMGLTAKYGLAPTSETYGGLESELARIRANAMLADPAARERLGVPQDVTRVGDLDLINKMRESMGLTVRDTTQTGGTETKAVNPVLRIAESIEGVGLRPPSGLLGPGANVELSFDPETGRMTLKAGPDALDPDDWQNTRADVMQRGAALEGFASVGNQLMERVLAGEDAATMGVTGDMIASLKSGLQQAGALNRAANWGGARTVGQLLDKATDSEFITKTAELSAGLTPLHYLLATTYAAAQGNKEIGKAELQAALAATQGVRRADPGSIAAALREAMRGLSNANRSYFELYKVPAPDVEALAPAVFQGGLAPILTPPEGTKVPDALRRAPGEPPRVLTLDEAWELYREQYEQGD
jgi:hypothetical protein